MSGKPIPKVIAGSDEIVPGEQYKGDAGQLFAKQLNSMIRGYKATLIDREDIIVMALDSATTGRMAITYYRELQASEFLERIKKLARAHRMAAEHGERPQVCRSAQPQRHRGGSVRRRAVYEKGKRPSKLLKATIQRLLPCIIDGRDIPLDLVQSCVRRAASRIGLARSKDGSESEFEFCLGIACSLLRQSRPEEQYDIGLG